MTIGERIKYLRSKKGLTLEYIAKIANTSRQTIQRYESGVIQNIPSDKIELIAKALHTTPAYLMGWDIPDPIPVTSVRMIPVIGAVYAGAGGIAQLDYQGEEAAYNFTANGEHYYFVVKGDSMMPDIHPGDLALVRLQDEVECGELAVCIINGEEGVIKRVQRQKGAIVLMSANPVYPPRVFVGKDMNEVKIWGRVMKTERKY